MKRFKVFFVLLAVVVVLVAFIANTASAIEYVTEGYTLSDYDKTIIEAVIAEKSKGGLGEISKILLKVRMEVEYSSSVKFNLADFKIIDTNGKIFSSETMNWRSSILENMTLWAVNKRNLEINKNIALANLPLMHGDIVVEERPVDSDSSYFAAVRVGNSAITVEVHDRTEKFIFSVWNNRKVVGKYYTLDEALESIPTGRPPQKKY